MHSKEPQHMTVCHKGVVLRLLILILVLTGLFCGFVTNSVEMWFGRWVNVCVGAVPACLLWLLVACSLSKPTSHWPAWAQQVLYIGLGAMAGAYGYAQFSVLAWLFNGVPQSLWGWLAPVFSGAFLAGICRAWLLNYQKRQDPAQIQAHLFALQAKIQPHFLFNTINTALALIHADPLRAEEVLLDLAELFRRALASPDAQIPLLQEIDLAKRYLAIEQLRFGDRLKVKWHVDEQANEVMSPVLLLQPLVENAIRHGIDTAVDGGWLIVKVKLARGRVVLTVINSLPTSKPSNEQRNEQRITQAGHGLALDNIQERLKLLHDLEADFQAGEKNPTQACPQKHFQVRCSWPV